MNLKKLLLPIHKTSHPFDEKIARVNRLLALAAILSIGVWLAEFIVVFNESQPHCDLLTSITINRFTIWRLSYPQVTVALEAIYTALTACILILLCILYGFLYISQRTAKQRNQMFGFFRSRYLIYLIMELGACILQPIPFHNADQKPIEKMKRLATPTIADPDPVSDAVVFDESMVGYGILMLIRFYLVIRYVRDHVDIYKKRREAQMLGLRRFHEINFDWQLSLKVLYVRRPAIFTAMFVGTILSFGALGYFVTESFAAFHIDAGGCISNNFETWGIHTSFYLGIITLTTVGYGDFFPVTPLGRLTSACVGIGGMFSSAMIVSTFFRWLDLTPMEQCVKAWCDAQKFHVLEQKDAALIIQKFWKSLGLVKHSNAAQSMQAMRHSQKRRRPIVTPPSDLVLAEIHQLYLSMKNNRLQKILCIKEHNTLVEEVDQDGVEVERAVSKNVEMVEVKMNDIDNKDGASTPPTPPQFPLNGNNNRTNSDDAKQQLLSLQEKFHKMQKEAMARQTAIEEKLEKLVAAAKSGKFPSGQTSISQQQMDEIVRCISAQIEKVVAATATSTAAPLPPAPAPAPAPAPGLFKSSADDEDAEQIRDWV